MKKTVCFSRPTIFCSPFKCNFTFAKNPSCARIRNQLNSSHLMCLLLSTFGLTRTLSFVSTPFARNLILVYLRFISSFFCLTRASVLFCVHRSEHPRNTSRLSALINFYSELMLNAMRYERERENKMSSRLNSSLMNKRDEIEEVFHWCITRRRDAKDVFTCHNHKLKLFVTKQ